MKRYGQLYDQVCSKENVELAIYKAAKNKKRKHGILNTLRRKDKAVLEIMDMLKTGSYQTSPYHTKIVYEPKMRIIYSLPFFPDRIIHHALMNVLEPIWDKQLDADSFSNRQNKGTHPGSIRCMDFARKYRYVLKCDVHKFYQSMDHNICKSIIRKKIKDKKMLNLLDEIIDSANTIKETPEGKNAPIGNLLSQWLGNLYMNEVDLWLRHVCKVHAMVRYCDDFIIFSDSKVFLNDIKQRLPEFLYSHLKLTLSKADVFPVARGIDFLGYRHFPRFVLVRKRNARNIKTFVHGVESGEIVHDKHSQGTAASHHGTLRHASSYNFRRAHNFDAIFNTYKEAPNNEAV